MSSAITTYTGKRFDVLNPRPEDVCLKDIAHALTQIPRFGGHGRERYTVAQHSCRLAQLLPLHELRLPGLLHDAAEAYLGDIPTPIKDALNLRPIEQRILETIFTRFGIRDALPLDYRIKGLDYQLKLGEGMYLVPDGPWKELGQMISPVPFETMQEALFCVEFHFMELFYQYGGRES